MDIKHLEQVNRDGLELWRPVMKSPLPISPDEARSVLTALGMDAPPLSLERYEVADIVAAAPELTLVPVHKSRRHYTFRGCMAEVTAHTLHCGRARRQFPAPLGEVELSRRRPSSRGR